MVFTERFSIRIFIDPQKTSLNQNKGLTKRARWAFRALQRRAYEAAREAWGMAGRPTVEHKVRVEYHVYRGRSLDDDNAVGGLKKVRDALFNAGITPHDARTWFEFGGLHWHIGQEWVGKEQVIVVVAPRTDLPKPKPPKPASPEDAQAKLLAKALRQATRGR